MTTEWLGHDTPNLLKHRFKHRHNGYPWGLCSRCWREASHPIHTWDEDDTWDEDEDKDEAEEATSTP